MKVLRFIRDWWYLPFFVVGAIAAMILFSRKNAPWSATEKIETEVAAIKAQREARDLRLQFGAEQAKQRVLDKYSERRKSLDAVAEARAKSLENDPEKLAKALERLTR